LGQLTQEKVANYLAGWNASIFSTAQNEVVFDFSIYGLIQSQRFWGGKVDVQVIIWNEVSYDQGTGVHRISANHAALGNNPSFIQQYVRDRLVMYEGEENITPIISHDNMVIVFEITRDAALRFFKWNVKKKVKESVKRRRWRIISTAVDNVIAQGKIVTVDWATFQTYLRDKWAE
jgi:hypothetical protein